MNVEPLKRLIADLGLETDLWWMAMMLVGFLAMFLGAFAYPGAALFWVWLAVMLRMAVAVGVSQQAFGTVFRALLPFALAVGACSIFGDFLLVHWHERGQRSYPAGTAVILASPLYMPLFWACSIVEFGYAILRIWGMLEKRGPGEPALYATMVLGGLLAAVWTACTDFWAVKAGLWAYEPGIAVVRGSCALYVVIGTFFIFFPFMPIFGRFMANPGTRLYAAVRAGLSYGGVIFVSYVAAHAIVERRL
jgi:hypothetical protein